MYKERLNQIFTELSENFLFGSEQLKIAIFAMIAGKPSCFIADSIDYRDTLMGRSRLAFSNKDVGFQTYNIEYHTTKDDLLDFFEKVKNSPRMEFIQFTNISNANDSLAEALLELLQENMENTSIKSIIFSVDEESFIENGVLKDISVFGIGQPPILPDTNYKELEYINFEPLTKEEIDEIRSKSKNVTISQDILDTLKDITDIFSKETSSVSEFRQQQLIDSLKICALLNDRDTVEFNDLCILPMVFYTPEDATLLMDNFDKILSKKFLDAEQNDELNNILSDIQRFPSILDKHSIDGELQPIKSTIKNAYLEQIKILYDRLNATKSNITRDAKASLENMTENVLHTSKSLIYSLAMKRPTYEVEHTLEHVKSFFEKIPTVENKIYKYYPITNQRLKELVSDENICLGDIYTGLMLDFTSMFYETNRIDFSGIEDWDVSLATTMMGMFAGCEHFNQPLNSWDVSKVTNMSYMFAGCTNFNQPLDSWNVSNVTNMEYMFGDCLNFNQPLDSWNVSNVTNMEYMFGGCENFNQPLDSWNVSSVTNMDRMFEYCASFNQPLDSWDVSNVTNMNKMFANSAMRNSIPAWYENGNSEKNANFKYFPESQDELLALINDEEVYLGAINTSNITNMSYLFANSSRDNFDGIEFWDVSNVTSMSNMFNGCKSFNQPLNSWDVSNVTSMRYMFAGCKNFNQPLDSWNVSNVTDMGYMFAGCKSFNHPLDSWDVSNVTDMSRMFEDCENFNQPLDSWDVSNVSGYGGMISMFAGCENFNQPLDSWNVSNVTDMDYMFEGCENFNQPLNSWDVSNVTSMSSMFAGCKSFNQPLDSWDISNVTDMSYMFVGCKNFNQPLDSWNVNELKNQKGIFYHTSMQDTLPSWCKDKIPTIISNSPKTKDELKYLMYDENIYLGDINTSEITDMSDLCNGLLRDDFDGIEFWDVSNVTNMSGMFVGCKNFNKSLNSWDVSNVTDMNRMFSSCENFNQPLDSWNTSKVTNMCYMFNNCPVFNQNINSWNVSNVEDMSSMFADCKSFNQPLDSWDVSNVTSMSSMFEGCVNFNQLLDSWDVFNVDDMEYLFRGCKNFDQLPRSWRIRGEINTYGIFEGCMALKKKMDNE